MRRFLFIVLLGCTLSAEAQLKEAVRHVMNVYGYAQLPRTDFSDSIYYFPDSIRITARFTDRHTSVTCQYLHKKTLLNIDYVFDEHEPVFVEVREQSPLFHDKSRHTCFYYYRGEMYDSEVFWEVSICMAIPKDSSLISIYGYDPELDVPYLQQFVRDLLNTTRSLNHPMNFPKRLSAPPKKPGSAAAHFNIAIHEVWIDNTVQHPELLEAMITGDNIFISHFTRQGSKALYFQIRHFEKLDDTHYQLSMYYRALYPSRPDLSGYCTYELTCLPVSGADRPVISFIREGGRQI